MLLIIILIIFIISLLSIYYKTIIKPKSILKKYAKQFQKNGYKVCMLDFVPFGTAHQKFFRQGVKKHNDCHYYMKNQMTQYDIILCNYADIPSISLNNCQLFKEFFQLQSQKTMRKHPFFTKQFQRMVGKSVTFQQGAIWKLKRKVITQFLNYNYIKSISKKIQSITKRQIQKFYMKYKVQEQKKNGKPIARIYLQQLFEMITSCVITEVFFGGGKQKIDQIYIQGKSLPSFMRQLMQDIFNHTLDPLSLMLGVKFTKLGLRKKDRQFNQRLRKFREVIINFIHNKMYQIQQNILKNGKLKQAKDIIQAFYIQTGSQNIKKNKQKFIEHLIDGYAGLYTAGTDTTQHATMMLNYYIYSNPDIKMKILKELEKNNISKQNIEIDTIKNLIYLQAVVLQTLRCYQTANGIFPRQLIQNIKIGNTTILKETIVATQTFPTHYKKQIYQNPNQFKPQRWIDGEGKIKQSLPYSLNTFSHGIRSCIGKQLALQQMKLITLHLMFQFKIQMEKINYQLNFKGFAYEPESFQVKIWPKDQ